MGQFWCKAGDTLCKQESLRYDVTMSAGGVFPIQ